MGSRRGAATTTRIRAAAALLVLLGGAAERVVGAAEPAPRPMSFRAILEAVAANNPALLAARSGVDAADADVERAWTQWQPRLTAIGQLTLNSVEQELKYRDLVSALLSPFMTSNPDFYNMAVNMAPKPIAIVPYVQWTGLLSVSQTLFNIGVLRSPGAARAARAAADAGAVAAEDDLLFSAATSFATLVGLRALEGAADRAIEVADKRVADARLRVEAGAQTRLALTRAETERVVAEGQRESVRAQRRGLLASLAAMIGTTAPIEVEDIDLAAVIPPPDDAGDASRRAVLVARAKALDAAEQAIGLVDMSWLPSLTLDGTLRYANVSGFATSNFLGTATINLAIPLYDQGVRYADLHGAEARAAKAAHELEAERLNAAAFLEDARGRLEAAEAGLRQAEAELRLATAAVAEVELLAKNGAATNLDLDDSDGKRYSADRALAQRRTEANLARLRLHYALGGKLLSTAHAR
jgi:outer membrane protein TolC